MSVGIGLIKSLCDQNVRASVVYDHGIGDHLFTPDERAAWDFVRDFCTTHGRYPSVDTVVGHYPELSVRFDNMPDEPFTYWADLGKKRRVTNLAREMADTVHRRMSAGANIDTDDLTRIASRFISDARSCTGSKIVSLSDITEELLRMHDHRQLATGISGIPTGFPFFDRVFDGLQTGDVLSLVGKTGMGKSFVMAKMWNAAYDNGYSPFVASMEMPIPQQARRTLALRSRLPGTAIRVGRLDFAGRELLGHTAEAVRENRQQIWFTDHVKSVDEIAAVARDLGANPIFIDGAYIIDENDRGAVWERVGKVAQNIRDMAMSLGVSVVSSYQFNNSGEGLHNIHFSPNIKYLASIVLGLRQEEPRPGVGRVLSTTERKILEILKGREGEYGAIEVEWDMRRTNICQRRVLWSRADDDESDGGDEWNE